MNATQGRIDRNSFEFFSVLFMAVALSEDVEFKVRATQGSILASSDSVGYASV